MLELVLIKKAGNRMVVNIELFDLKSKGCLLLDSLIKKKLESETT